MNMKEAQEELLRLKAENDALKQRAVARITMKVSEKGGLSVYGLGRWPVTLYRQQWESLLAQFDAIKAFIAANEATLKVKE